VVAASEAQTAALWALRENVSEAQKIEGVSIKHDIAVPVSRIAEFIARADAALAAAFPACASSASATSATATCTTTSRRPMPNPTPEFIARTEAVNRVVHDLVHELGGSISAEHGLGQLKREEVLRYKSETEMDLMRAVKQALDPRGLMNPGKLL
jgi:FAD/FMN-containing dehydrogenase